MSRSKRQSKQHFVLHDLRQIQLLSDRQRVERILQKFFIRQLGARRPQLEENIVPDDVLDWIETTLTCQPNQTGNLDMHVGPVVLTNGTGRMNIQHAAALRNHTGQARHIRHFQGPITMS